MHRTAFTITQAVLLTSQLQHHPLKLAALGDTVPMTPVRTRDVIVIRHIEAGTHSNGFLITIHMNKPRQLTLLIFRSYSLFELANGLH